MPGRAEMPGAEGTQPVVRPGSSPDVGRGEPNGISRDRTVKKY